MSTKILKFQNKHGQTLSAKLELPIDQKPFAYVLFAHCFTCSKNYSTVTNISRTLAQHGFGVLRFDFTGLGESEGDFADTNFSSNIEDLLCAADYLKDNYESPKLLVGHSLGGAAVIFASKSIDSVEAIATIGAPSSPEHVKDLFKSSTEEIEQNNEAEVQIAGRSFKIKKQFIEDISDKNMKEILANLKKSLLILHSPQDNIVGIDNAAKIYTSAKHPKSFITLDGADHLLNDKEDSIYAGNTIAAWASRYIKKLDKSNIKTNKQVAVQIGSESYTTEILAGKHRLRADEPESVGGNDFGPNPYDLLLTSLGACTAMTMRMYADRKKWKIEEINVHLKHSKDYVEDCQNCDTKKVKIDVIERSIEIKGDLDEEQRSKLLEIADKCPVHRTLHSEIQVKTSLVN